MDNITLTAATHRTEEFNNFYHFLSEQILDELGRKKMLKLITNDSTPIVVEDELSNTIGEIFKRFEVYDYPITIGYCRSTITDLDTDETEKLKEQAFYLFPFPVEIEHIETTCGQIRVSPDKYDIAKKEVNNVIFLLTEAKNQQINISKYHPEDIKNDNTHRIEYIVEKYEPRWLSNGVVIEYDDSIYEIKKRISSIPEFAGMNITSTSVAEMLIGDLIDKAIEIEKSTK